MAHRHLLTVCVVCLLCAQHLPCKQHEKMSSSPQSKIDQNVIGFQDETIGMLNLNDVAGDEFYYDKRKDKVKDDEHSVRRKRHAAHGSHSPKHHRFEMPYATNNYIEKIFNNNSEMSLHEFKDMISQLNLKSLFNHKSQENDAMCMNEESFLDKFTKHDEDEEEKDHHHDEKGNHDHHPHHDVELTKENFLSICPILLYYAINPNESTSCFNRSNLITDVIIENDGSHEMEDRNLVWLYATLSVVLVSLCGLFGVAVIPIMEKHFYHHILQFLVALAVGTLAGDALLHLLPHSMMPLTPDQDLNNRTMMYRGLAALMGIVFFYFFERFIAMVMEWRQKKEKREKPSSRVRVMRDPHDPETISLNGAATTCKHKYSSYPYCYDEITMETKDDHHEHQHIEEEQVLNNHRDLIIIPPTEPIKKLNGLITDNSNDLDNNTLSTSLDDGSIESNALCNNNKQLSKPVSNSTNNKNESVPEEGYTIILR